MIQEEETPEILEENAKTSEEPERDQAKPDSQNNPRQFIKKNKKLLIIVGIIVLLLLLLCLLLFRDQLTRLLNTGGGNPNQATGSKSGETSEGKNEEAEQVPKTAIIKVGKEYILKEDLDVELANYQGVKNDEATKVLKEKLVKDSITLQAAQAQNMVKLESDFYNNRLKNYGKRFKELKNVQTKLDNNRGYIAGKFVTVWFYNMYPAKIGLEKGKEEAFKRISELHRRVVSKEITIEQAGEIIKNDTSYSNLDVGHMVNAFYEFKEPKGDKITFDEGYDQILLKSSPGAITDVYLASTINEFTKKRDEAFYIFGVVTEKVEGNGPGYTKWYEEQKGKYEVTYY